MENLFKRHYPVLFLVLLSVILYLLSNRIPQESIASFLNNAGLLGTVLFVLLNTITYIIAPLSNTPLMFAGFSVFGREMIWYIAAAMVVSYLTNFWIARKWGRGMVIRLIGEAHIERVDKLTHDRKMTSLFFFLRVFQGGAQDFISFAAGLSSLKFSSYFLASVLGTVPQMIIWYILAYQTSSTISFILLSQAIGLIMPAIFLVALFIASKVKFLTRSVS